MSAPDIAPEGQAWTRRPAWAALLCGTPLLAGIWAGPMFIDDAYITFRYAENIARGNGFVYNSDPVLGTTAPLYCLLLAGARLLGAPVTVAAWAIGVAAAALAPLLVWRLGIAARQSPAGLAGGALLALFPVWWKNSVSGMETTLAGAMAAAVCLLDLKNKPGAAGAVAGALVLTRPDAALLPAIIFLLALRRDRRAARRFALAGAATVLPWAVFATAYFGSPLPHSLAAKGLIHAYPAHLALGHYLQWFAAVVSPPGMALMSAAWLAGMVCAVRKERALLAAALWPPIFLLGLALTRVGPFFWYKVPALPLYFLIAGLGFSWLATLGNGQGRAAAARAGAWAVPAIFIVLQLVAAGPYLLDRERLGMEVEKERILRAQSEIIRERAALGVGLASVKVFAGEVGVPGWELMDAEIIDSAGINSPEVLEARRRDWEALAQECPACGWREKWSGTPGWSREIIAERRPDFILSNADYCHLRVLARERGFQARYRSIDQRQDRSGQVFVLYERNPEMDNEANSD